MFWIRISLLQWCQDCSSLHEYGWRKDHWFFDVTDRLRISKLWNFGRIIRATDSVLILLLHVVDTRFEVWFVWSGYLVHFCNFFPIFLLWNLIQSHISLKYLMRFCWFSLILLVKRAHQIRDISYILGDYEVLNLCFWGLGSQQWLAREVLY